MIYFRYDYDLGEPKREYLGPFDCYSSARQHVSVYGGTHGELINLEAPPTDGPIWEPADHAEHQLKRGL